jgi:PIN domain nuclease of toxin-antitoxin system
LLDTHVLIWFLESPEVLKPTTHQLIANPENELFLSAVSAWEISIKYAIGKIRLPLPPGEFVASRCKRFGISQLPVTFAHAGAVAQLPRHHGDPFDRMLVAQAIIESLPIVTADRIIGKYNVNIIEAK